MNQLPFNMDKDPFIPRCFECGKVIETKWLSHAKMRVRRYGAKLFCCQECNNLYNNHLPTKVNHVCTQCGKTFVNTARHDQRKKSTRVFCSKSCAATYNNTHKKVGIRRSKLEIWLESKLTELYPSLQIDYNKTYAIDAELDIYIPSLKLAFELNGIFHYEPIFGDDRFAKQQKNDANKFKLCHDHSISLCVIDTSKQKHFTEKSSQQYLDIITKIIDENLAGLDSNQCSSESAKFTVLCD